MRILICFDAPVEQRGVINGHAFYEVKELTEKELQRVCEEQRTLMQRSLARGAAIAKEKPPIVQPIVLRSVLRLNEESRIITPR